MKFHPQHLPPNFCFEDHILQKRNFLLRNTYVLIMIVVIKVWQVVTLHWTLKMSLASSQMPSVMSSFFETSLSTMKINIVEKSRLMEVSCLTKITDKDVTFDWHVHIRRWSTGRFSQLGDVSQLWDVSQSGDALVVKAKVDDNVRVWWRGGCHLGYYSYGSSQQYRNYRC